MSLIVAGRAGAREVALTTRRSREGRDIIRTITGPAADVFAIEAAMYAGGATEVNTTQQVGSPLATMVVRYAFANGDTPEEDTGLISEEVSASYAKTPIPIRQHDYFGDLAIDGIITIDNAIAANEDFPAGGDGITADTRWEEYYLLRRMGVNEFEAELPAVRYTIRCAAQYAGLLETDNVGVVFTKAQMLDRISTPRFFDVTEPADVFNANAYGYFYPGWRLTAAVSFDNDGKGILEETYTWGQFAKQLYAFNFDTP
jgi:hypothetical protein